MCAVHSLDMVQVSGFDKNKSVKQGFYCNTTRVQFVNDCEMSGIQAYGGSTLLCFSKFQGFE